ncbi:MAG: RNA polymerase sigma factor [Chryseotalea sp.]
MVTDADSILINRILAGEQHLFAQLVNKHKSYAYSLALRIIENKADAEEIAQDSFVKAFKYLASFQQESKFSTWLYRIVFNTAITYKRKNKVSWQSIEQLQKGYWQDDAEQADKKKFIAQAIHQLPEHDQAVITLYYMQELSLEEMAEILQSPANTVKVRVHRARLKLAEILKTILKKEALTL